MEKESVIQKIRKLLKLQYSAEKVGNAGEDQRGYWRRHGRDYEVWYV